METIIEAKGLTKSYKDIKVLNDLTFSIKKGETLAIIGENGSGKSTLLQLIAGLYLPSEGIIEKIGSPIRIGYVPEQFPSNIRFTVSEYLYHLGRIEGISKLVLQKRIRKLLVQFHLTQSEGMKIKTFSKGMKQKVGIIQALLSEPDILILDEPLSGLDQAMQQHLESILYGFKSKGLTMVLSCHSKKLLQRVANRVIVLHKSQIADDYMTADFPIQEYVRIEVVTHRENIDFIKQFEGIIETKFVEDHLILSAKSSISDHVIAKLIENGFSINSVSILDGVNPAELLGETVNERGKG